MLKPEEEAELDVGATDGKPESVGSSVNESSTRALPPGPDLPALEPAGEYAYAISNVTIRSFLLTDWALGYFIPVLHGARRASSYHAPDPNSAKPQTACHNYRPGDREWRISEWCDYHPWAEPCGTAKCQEQFEKMGLDVHSNGRGW